MQRNFETIDELIEAMQSTNDEDDTFVVVRTAPSTDAPSRLNMLELEEDHAGMEVTPVHHGASGAGRTHYLSSLIRGLDSGRFVFSDAFGRLREKKRGQWDFYRAQYIRPRTHGSILHLADSVFYLWSG